jgi:NADH-quinone oxidoreductase subunit J
MILALLSALVAIAGGIGAVSARQLMRAVASLTLLFLGLAGLFGLLGAPYLAAAQLFLFVGGVVTLLALAFGSVHTPITRGTVWIAIAIALLGILVGSALMPSFADAGTLVEPSHAAGVFFARYGPLLAVALLIILSGIISVGYVLAERAEGRK